MTTGPAWPRYWDNSDPQIVEAMAELDRIKAGRMTLDQLQNVVRLFTGSRSQANEKWALACQKELEKRRV